MTWPNPVNGLARIANGYKHWLADLNRESFSAVITQILWFYGSIRFTNVAATLMLDEGPRSESHYSWGFQIVVALLGAWGFKTAAGVVDSQGKRKTNVPYVEAKERGKAQGEAAVPPTIQAQTVQKVEVVSPKESHDRPDAH